jgi:histidinol-phosphatase
MEYSATMAVALRAARAAGDVVMPWYRRDCGLRQKDDGSPVTAADLAAEQTIRAMLTAAFPDDGFLGEETGRAAGPSGRTWVVDPIDGTRSFVRGYAFFSTQIALLAGESPVLGVSAAPAFAEVAFAESGRGAWLGGERLAVSGVRSLRDATVSIGNLGAIARDGRWRGLGRIADTVERFRGYGDFYHYHLLAAGRLDAVIECDIAIHDIAALTVIVREAGGCVTDLEGRPVTSATTSILATNGHLHAAVGEMLHGTGAPPPTGV